MKNLLITAMMWASVASMAQPKIDEARMQRDIEITENILSTLIKQQLGKRNFFPMEVQGSYLPGYGITYRLPSGMFGNIIFMQDGGSWNIDMPFPEEPSAPGETPRTVNSYSYSYSSPKTRDKLRTKNSNTDSSQIVFNQKLLEASKNFIADYGDLLSQLQPNEKIVITNRGEGRNNFHFSWSGNLNDGRKQNVLSIEGTKSDISQLRQGKISRDQLMAKLKIVNSEVSNDLQPDLETLSSIFGRLYSRDLSKTFFTDGNLYYERLKDFGVIYHMQVYASNQEEEGVFDLPTIRRNNLDQSARDKEVKRMYPEFEQSIKEDFLEYGKTVKSLKDDEVLMLEIQLTRCGGCAIPTTLELSVKNSVLKDYSSGKLSKEAALAKLNLKKGADQ
ncbi:MAG: hypothetical protein OJF59_001975 [Cytophagales bacterium]|jgi:hypothetical protein|nr:hypothetical protein [Bacteroidota bacterium]MBS1980875.1 hypothetical protein [Bacteroidota bacterium]WHZ08222.1 MAG: hypothetical protein OJF59_001975 [Cytophagales bacterium]